MKLGSRPTTGIQLIALFRYTLFMAGIGLFAAGVYMGAFNLQLSGVLVFFVSNVFFGFAEGKTRYVFLFFHLAVFTFLLGRPLIEWIEGEKWWLEYGKAATQLSLSIILTALIALRFGAIIGDGILKRFEFYADRGSGTIQVSRFSDEYKKAFLRNLQIVSILAFAVTIAASYAEGIEQIRFMAGKTYNEYFLEYESTLPYAVVTLASMAKYAAALSLATMPKKKISAAILFFFLLDAVPSLIIGVRNPLILRIIFALIYFIMRDTIDHSEKWFGFKEKAVLVIGTPAAIAFLGLYASIRVGKGAKGGFFYYIFRFFYNQGVTFDTVRSICPILPQLHRMGMKNFTFGMLIDYFKFGNIAQKFFGMPNIGNANSAAKALYGNDLAHTSYYIIDPGMYLKGWGKGSSYMIENYVDAGYAGVIAFGLVLGAVLILLTYMMKCRNTLVRTIALVSLLGLFFIPRAESTSWIAFLVYFQFWALVIAVYFIAGLCVKGYLYKRNTSLEESVNNV